MASLLSSTRQWRRLAEGLPRRASFGRPAAAVGLFSILLATASCDAGPVANQTNDPTSGSPEAAVPPGHSRMLQSLREVREAEASNPYLGIGELPAMRSELAALPDGVPDLRRWLFNKLIGKNELRMGNEDVAVEHYLAAYEQLSVFPDEIPQEEQIQTVYELGVAFLRQGETANCALRHTAESCLFPISGTGVHQDQEGSTEAAGYFKQVLERTEPGSWMHLKARWLLNIAYMTLGRYPDGVPEPWRIAPATFDSDQPFPRFKDVAPELGINPFDLAGGAIVDDFNGDGLPDILVSSSSLDGAMHYYRNDGDGGFSERSEQAGLEGLVGGLNMTQADYDNDGDPDVLVLRGAWWRQFGHHPNSLLRNNGNETFTDVTFEAGLGEQHFPTQTADWADYDNDGDLDLYIGNEYDPFTEAASQLFRNNGDGTFTDVAAAAGVTNDRYAKGVSWGDYNGDRFPDLYVSNMSHRNRLYRNEGDGTFTDVGESLNLTRPVASFGTWFWDYDNDGALDIFVAAYGGRRLPPDVGSVAASYLDLPHRAELAHLYRGDGKGGFEDVSERSNLALVTLPMGANFGDIDNDGYLDFYLGTGYPYYEALMPNVLYRNRDGAGFADVTTSAGVGHLQKGHGVVFADLDQDGDQDLFEQIGGQYPGDAFGNVLFENPGFGHHWIKLKLVGVKSNRAGVGARIRIDIVEAGKPRSIHRHVTTGGSFGCNPLRQEIGLRRATRIERLEIFWPTSGQTQRFDDVAVDQAIEITEGRDEFRRLPLKKVRFGR